MKSCKYEGILIWIAYFIVLIGIALFVRDIPNQPDAANLSAQQLIDLPYYGLSDPIYFAKSAVDIANNGWISSTNEWVLNLWPPGFILLEALIIKSLGFNTPMILILQLLASGLFATVLLLIYSFLKEKTNNKIAILLPIAVFAFPVSRVFLLQPKGISLGESFSVGFFLIFIMLALLSVKRKTIGHAVSAGLFLALAAYFRSQFEIILLALSVFGILYIIKLKLNPFANSNQLGVRKPIIRTMFIVLLVSHSTTIPWRIYHWINQESPVWVQTASVTFGNSVIPSEELHKKFAGFVAEGGGNLVCRIDAKTCGDTANAKILFIRTFLNHPIEWYSLKLNVIGKYWFSSTANWTSVVEKATTIDYVTNALLLFIIIAVLGILLTRRLRSIPSEWTILMWINLSLIFAYGLIFTVQQFEVRYFYFPKIVGIVMLIICMSLYIRPLKDK